MPTRKTPTPPTTPSSTNSSPPPTSANAGHSTGSTRSAGPKPTGSEANLYRKNAWIYRDYVVRAFNEDLPYDRFITEQIAGDQLGAGEATGFLVAGPHVPAATVGREPDRHPPGTRRPHGRNHADHRLVHARRHRRLRPLPQPQVRSHLHQRLLRPHRRLPRRRVRRPLAPSSPRTTRANNAPKNSTRTSPKNEKSSAKLPASGMKTGAGSTTSPSPSPQPKHSASTSIAPTSASTNSTSTAPPTTTTTWPSPPAARS